MNRSVSKALAHFDATGDTRQAMSEENVEIVRRAFEHYRATGELLAENYDVDFVWDMSTFRGWPDRQAYPGVEGASQFIADWNGAWEDLSIEVGAYIDAGDDLVVTIVHQHGRSRTSGVLVDMHFGQVFTIRGGKHHRMQMYASPSEALEAAGLAE
jgi:ketosteroid isomerase-like protein